MFPFDFAIATTARKSITLVLGILLLSGTITSFYQSSSSSSLIKNAQAQSVNKLLEDIYCNNINLNGNDISINTLPQPFAGLLSQEQADDHGIDNSEQKSIDGFVLKCINNNENEFAPPQSIEEKATLSINKDWFVCNNDSIDCIIEPQEEDEQISFEGPNSGNYTQCTSDGQCPFANDSGFSISITGNSPIPKTIPAQINTQQQVEIGTGPFSVSEELFSQKLVPNANIRVQNVPVGDLALVLDATIISFDENGQRVFTANFNGDSVSIIDLTDNSVTDVDLAPSGGDGPNGIAFDQNGQSLFVSNFNSNSVSIIDLTDNSVTDVDLAASGGINPVGIAFDTVGQRVFTANQGSDSVSIIDLTDNSVTDIDLAPSGGDAPRVIAFDQNGQRVFTANPNSNSVSIIDLTDNSVTDIDLVPSAGTPIVNPVAIAFDENGQRLFTANANSGSVSIIDLTDNSVTDVDLAPSGLINPFSIVFDENGQRVFSGNANGDSVSIIDLTDNSVTNVDLVPSGGDNPVAIAFDENGQRVLTANLNSNSVSIIDLTDNSVTDVDLAPSGGSSPVSMAFDENGQRLFTADVGSDSISIIDLPTVSKICQNSGFDTGDIRTFVSDQQTLQQVSCVNFVGQCSGNIDVGETKECTVDNYVVSLDELPSNGSNGVGILSSNFHRTQQNQLFTTDTENKIKTTSLPTLHFSFDDPIH